MSVSSASRAAVAARSSVAAPSRPPHRALSAPSALASPARAWHSASRVERMARLPGGSRRSSHMAAARRSSALHWRYSASASSCLRLGLG